MKNEKSYKMTCFPLHTSGKYKDKKKESAKIFLPQK